APQLRVSEGSDTLYFSAKPRYALEFLPGQRGHSDEIGQVVGAINIEIEQEKIYAGYIIQKYGLPCFVQPMYGGLGLGYPNVVFLVGHDLHKLRPEALIRYIILRQPSTATQCTSIGSTPIFKWNGFGRYF